MKGFFVTGTDTEIGKTWSSVAVLHALRERGFRVNAIKPVAAGEDHPSDASLLESACGHPIEPALLNPFAFPEPVSPHLAAQLEGQCVELPPIVAAARRLADDADLLLAEGAGGWMVPLGGPDGQLLMPDLVKALDLPVILVVGLKLGCLNHALLSAAQISASGCTLAGWIGNTVDPAMRLKRENIDTLNRLLPVPSLGILPRLEAPADGASYLDLSPLKL
ncbi:MAG: dethiobiotin synthase [Pseudomonadota bacterium]